MRTLWVLILFGSLIIHHCFTTTSGEAVQAATSKEPHPSFSDCKPYVDAALKGDIPGEPEVPEDASASDEDDDTNEQTDHQLPADDNEDDEGGSSEEDEGKSHPADLDGDSSEEDEEEPEINGLEVEEDETPTATTTAKDSSEKETPERAPPPPAPASPKLPSKEKQPQGSAASSVKTKAEESGKEGESDESDEEDSGKATPKNTSPASPQRDRTSHHSLAQDADEPKLKPKQPEANNKKVSNPPKEIKSEVKKTPQVVVEEEDDESVEEEVVVKKNVKPTKAEPPKEKKVVKVEVAEEDDDDSSEEEIQAKPPPKNKGKKIEPVEAQDEDDSEEAVKPPSKKGKNDDKKGKEVNEKKAKAVQTHKKVEAENDDDDDDQSSEEDDDEKSYEPRSRSNLNRILGLDDTTDLKNKNNLLDKVTQQTLKELKSTYEYAIKPLETLYKYRDLSNRHFGDPEIFSKPMIVFMGPWSGGKSTIINWLLGIQDDEHALRTGADPSPAQFNILTHGSEEEVLDGTQLAADWTFSGLQKFGQSFLDRLRGRKLPNRLLEKVNLVEIPGILEIRKQVERSFPFNDACQWFIDRADVLFLVYDPAKLDIGPETEAILDQLKGRESQVRIVLNKADTVKPDELLRVQATLIWNISPLMASAEPPVLYVASLWDHPLQPDAPASLLNAHENLFLKDISDATHKRVETRIAAARRFAVRVRNHAKMCDCYLNTYNNHRSFFSNKKRISDDIIEHPQNYHIYEGLSTLTNISRYDLPDPDSYRDFFRLNPVWEFPSLASTCTYFRGCPINKLDIAIAYDLPELLGRYRRQRESIVTAPTGTLPDIKLKEVAEKKDAPIDIPKGKSRWYKLPLEEQQQIDEASKLSKQVAKGKAPREATPPPPQPTPAQASKEPAAKPKNKWWKEVPEVVVKPEATKTKEEGSKKSKKSEEPQKPEPPKEGFRLVQPKNKWWKAYYEPIGPKEPEQQQPKKNKWYKT